MILLFYITVCLAAFHYLWESILAPSFRLRLRFELFRLRDQLRWLEYEQAHFDEEDLFHFVQGSINNSLRLLPRIDFALLSNAQQIVNADEGLRRRIEKRRDMFESSNNQELKAIHRKLKELTLLAVGVNTAGLMIWVIPIFIALASWSGIKKFIKNIVLIPESELGKVAYGQLACA